ncbi:MAG: aminotransferase class I/II-fold pyridoxal phosphate-dependent enzyme [Bacteroidota bacterium]
MKNQKIETLAVRSQTSRTKNREHSVPIYPTSSYVFESAEHARALFQEEQEGTIYSRYSNPNNDEFIEKLCLMEGLPKGMATASGMGAVFTSLAAYLSHGDHLVASRSVFGSTHQIITNILPRWGITYTYVEGLDIQEWEQAIQPNTRMLFFETPSNPALDIFDIEAIALLGKSKGLIVNMDNCFATPYLQTPAKFGVDLITHSATKFIDGQGRVLGGAVITSEELFPKLKYMCRHTGPAMSPFHGWILSKSLETLAARMDLHCSNALKLAETIESIEGINYIKYPFLESHSQHELAKKQMKKGGGIVTIELDGGLERGKRFLDGLKMITLSANLGDTRSIATHPASTTHSKLTEKERQAVGITNGMVRISVGLEHVDDIIEDVSQAIEKSK